MVLIEKEFHAWISALHLIIGKWVILFDVSSRKSMSRVYAIKWNEISVIGESVDGEFLRSPSVR